MGNCSTAILSVISHHPSITESSYVNSKTSVKIWPIIRATQTPSKLLVRGKEFDHPGKLWHLDVPMSLFDPDSESDPIVVEGIDTDSV